MRIAESAYRAIRDIFLLRKQLSDIKEELTGNVDDMKALCAMVQSLSERVARIEGMIEGIAMSASASAKSSPRRLARPD